LSAPLQKYALIASNAVDMTRPAPTRDDDSHGRRDRLSILPSSPDLTAPRAAMPHTVITSYFQVVDTVTMHPILGASNNIHAP
jgi:hypothetical protein